MIAEAMGKVGRKGVVTLEEGRSSENSLYVVEGMQFDRGYISPYFVTDSEKMAVEYDNCKVCSRNMTYPFCFSKAIPCSTTEFAGCDVMVMWFY